MSIENPRDLGIMILDKEHQRQGILYVVATPIGNLEDISLRAIRVLKEVSLIAAEDTRRTRKLLNAYGIGTAATSLYEQNESRKRKTLVAKMLKGIDIAYVSDAGTPGVSDPGYLLVREALANGITVVPIPGACAAIAALSISGLPMDSFVFHGFLPGRSGKRQHFLKSLENETKTMVFYESPNRIMATLRDVESVLGNRQIVVTRELTKVYEEILRGSVAEVIEAFGDRVVKGEITLVIAGKERMERLRSEDDIRRLLALYEGKTLSKRDIIGKIALELGVPRKLVYLEAVKAKV